MGTALIWGPRAHPLFRTSPTPGLSASTKLLCAGSSAGFFSLHEKQTAVALQSSGLAGPGPYLGPNQSCLWPPRHEVFWDLRHSPIDMQGSWGVRDGWSLHPHARGSVSNYAANSVFFLQLRNRAELASNLWLALAAALSPRVVVVHSLLLPLHRHSLVSIDLVCMYRLQRRREQYFQARAVCSRVVAVLHLRRPAA